MLAPFSRTTSDIYVELKVKELTLVHERALQMKEQKERTQEALRAERESVRVERELQEALDDEERMLNLLKKARLKAEKASAKTASQLQNRVAELERQLKEGAERAERAKSMAEQTRAGHVYVISNIGSFGDGVFKIGMTRRLDPSLRVKELGDASVPFTFDVHAMIFCDDAPTLESELHRRFGSERVNLVNNRKEFFRVPLREIRNAVAALDPSAEFFLNAEAEQYRESEAIRSSQSEKKVKDAEGSTKFPEDF